MLGRKSEKRRSVTELKENILRDKLLQTRALKVIYSFPHTIRYLSFGVLNTALGYLIFIACYFLLKNSLNYFFIFCISYMISVTSAFCMQRYFVFNSRADWLHEYCRFFLVNTSGGVLNMVLLFMFKQMGMNIPLAQAIATFVVVIVSYVGHLKFTFKKPGQSKEH